MRTLFASACFVLSLATGFAGCGGSVVVDGSPDDGTGGSGGTTTGTTTTPTTTTITTTTDPASLCQQFCDTASKLGCDPGGPSCVSDCVQTFAQAGACAPQLDAAISCIVENPPVDCNLPGPACQSLFDAFLKCQGSSSCTTNGCSASSDGSCTCDGVCNGSSVVAECKPMPNGQVFCNCYVGGSTFGNCQGDGAAGCDLDVGCCSQFW